VAGLIDCIDIMRSLIQKIECLLQAPTTARWLPDNESPDEDDA